ncbi:MAG: CHAD domain-containing protein [Hyphomonadaceae bacterium]|nr:CHAD domain-containing protein [Hyphomonadaceae bacterium]
MSFILAPHETPGAGLTRAIQEQVAKLSVECVDAAQDASAFAHKARVRCKRVRAALRLAKPLMGAKAFRKENRWWRDQARLLSDLRDAGARLEALETLRPFLAARIGTAMTRKLGERFDQERQQVEGGEAVSLFIERMNKRSETLIPDMQAGTREDMMDALGETYRLGRIAMKAALKDEEPELLHEWRKQAKYHALHARLMRLQFPDVLDQRVAGVRDLAGLLGEVQDIEVVAAGAEDWREAPKGFFDVLKTRRNSLVTGARATGAALFAEKPKAWSRQLTPPVLAE